MIPDQLSDLDMARRDLLMRREELTHATKAHAQAQKNVEIATAKLRKVLNLSRDSFLSAESVIQQH